MTSLAVALQRSHHEAFARAPFEWDTGPRFRFKDGNGQPRELNPAAAFGTLAGTREGLAPLRALVETWPEDPDADWLEERLRTYALFIGVDTASPVGPWRRWYGRPPRLLVTAPSDYARARAVDILLGLAGHEPHLASLLRRIPVAVTSVDLVQEAGVAQVRWTTPMERRWQV